MRLAVFEQRQLLHRTGSLFVRCGTNGQGQQHFVRMQARIVVAKVISLQGLNGLNHMRCNQVNAVVNPAQHLQHIEQQRKLRVLPCAIFDPE